MTDNVERMSEYRQVYLGATIAAIGVPFLTLGYVALLDPLLGLGIMAACPLVPLAVWAFMRLFRKVSANSRRERARLSVQYLDALRNLIPIRLLGAGKRIEDRLRAQGEANRRAIMRLLAGNQVVIIVLDGALSLLLICWAVYLIGSRLAAGAITPGEAMSVALLLTLMLEPMLQVAGFFYIGMSGKASQRAIARQLSRIPADRPATAVAKPTEAAISIQGIHHDHGRDLSSKASIWTYHVEQRSRSWGPQGLENRRCCLCCAGPCPSSKERSCSTARTSAQSHPSRPVSSRHPSPRPHGCSQAPSPTTSAWRSPRLARRSCGRRYAAPTWQKR